MHLLNILHNCLLYLNNLHMCLMDSVSIVLLDNLSKNHYMDYIMDILHIYCKCL